jgi:hypothetical protein
MFVNAPPSLAGPKLYVGPEQEQEQEQELIPKTETDMEASCYLNTRPIR